MENKGERCMDGICEAYYHSEIGVLKITGTDEGILSVEFYDGSCGPGPLEIPACLQECIRQLNEYFKGTRKEFRLKLLPRGTDFQLRVWEKLQEIPYGKTASYGDIAKTVGNSRKARAVGGACNKNEIAVIIPCHRVIGSDGSLTGYAGGLWRKEWLLGHEGKRA